MITVHIKIDKDKRECSLSVKGHAGYADKGKDIVCSAASILAHTTAHCVEDMEHAGDLAEAPTIDMSEGECDIVLQTKPNAFEVSVRFFYTINKGYALLAKCYPQYVEYIVDDKAQCLNINQTESLT